jgi:hypothetical protein
MYAEAYTLVHLLLADRDGRRRLQDYVRDLAEDDGTHTQKITQRYFDVSTCERLAEPWASYVLSRSGGR